MQLIESLLCATAAPHGRRLLEVDLNGIHQEIQHLQHQRCKGEVGLQETDMTSEAQDAPAGSLHKSCMSTGF